MTLQGAVNKAFLLGVIAFFSGVGAVTLGLPYLFVLLALPVAIILAAVITVSPKRAPMLSPTYAISEGVVLGLISQLYAARYGGDIVVFALGVTAALFMATLAVYRSRIVKVTDNFRLGVFILTAGIAFYYLVAFLLRLFGMTAPLVASSSTAGLAFSAVVILLATANLVIDFDFIEKGAEEQAPKHMEWYAAFGLLVTVVWLYLEVLRLLAKLNDR